jgi:hypothetical protein
MTPFQTFYLILSLVVFALAWTRGGHTERAGVMMFIVAFLLSALVQDLAPGGFRLGEALVDLGFFVALVWLALRRDRWWTLACAALAGLTMAAHLATLALPESPRAHARADVAARWGIGVMMVLCLAGGVLERWMAGEEPASRRARWGRTARRMT